MSVRECLEGFETPEEFHSDLTLSSRGEENKERLEDKDEFVLLVGGEVDHCEKSLGVLERGCLQVQFLYDWEVVKVQ